MILHKYAFLAFSFSLLFFFKNASPMQPEDYYARIAKRNQIITKLKREIEENKAQQELIIEKIKIIEEVEKTIAYSYKQELLNKSSDELRLMLQDKSNVIQAIGINEEFSITQELIDVHRLEYDCLKEAFTKKRMPEQIALQHEQYGNDIDIYIESNNNDDLNNIIHERYNTLQKALNNNEAAQFNFQCNKKGHNPLEKRGLDVKQFEHIEGNAFVGQLCKEQCAIINQVGQLFAILKQSPHYIKAPSLFDLLQTPKEKLANVIQSSEQFVDCFLSLTIETIVLANQATRTANLVKAVKLNDFAQSIIEYLEQIITINKQGSIGFLIDDSKNVIVNLYRLGTDICHIEGEIANKPTKHTSQHLDKTPKYKINKSRQLEESFAKLIGDSIYYSGRSRKKAESYIQCNYYDRVSEILEKDAKYLETYKQQIYTQKTLPESARNERALFSEEIVNSEIRVLIGKACRLARIGGIRTKQLFKHSPNPKLLTRTPEDQFVKITKNSFKKYAKDRKAKSKIN